MKSKKKVSTSSSIEKRVKTLEKTVRCLSEELSNLDNSFMNNVPQGDNFHQWTWRTPTKEELMKRKKEELLVEQMCKWTLYFIIFVLFCISFFMV